MKSLASSLIVFGLFGTACSAQEGKPGTNPHAAAQPPQTPPPPLDWKELEAPILSNHVQLTSRDQFLKAGEAYFSPEGKWIIFQAVPAPASGQSPDQHYSMYVAKLKRAEGRISGIEKPLLVSPPGSWNSCGWFHPTAPHRVIFGSTITAPETEQKNEFRVGERTYKWMLPVEAEIVERSILEVFDDLNPGALAMASWSPEATKPKPLFERPDYDAECSFSPDGRMVLYAHVREERTGGRPDPDIWVYDTQTQKNHPLVTADGYDGGPFFSPDGKRICYRSDRNLNDKLQLFVADLKFDGGVPVGIVKEYQVTDNDHVNWAPYWDPTGSFLIYCTSEQGHMNYEVFAVEAAGSKLRSGAKPADLKRIRITQANGADVLPAFSPDGKTMMWTGQRGPMAPGEQKPSSQLWVADFNAAGLKLEQ